MWDELQEKFQSSFGPSQNGDKWGNCAVKIELFEELRSSSARSMTFQDFESSEFDTMVFDFIV